MPATEEQLRAEIDRRSRLSAVEAELAKRTGGVPAAAPATAPAAASTEAASVTPAPEPKETLSSMTGGLVSRPAFEAAGGTIGAVLGAGVGAAGGVATGPGAPVASPALAAAGMLAGDALGSAAGSLIFDTVQDAADYLGIVESAPPEMSDRIESAYKAGRDAMIYGPVAQVIGASPSMVRAGLGKVLGVSTEFVDDFMRAARNSGVMTRSASGEMIPAVGVADVAPGAAGQFSRITTRTFGIFPFIGGPGKTAAVAKKDAIDTASKQILDRLAPNATLQSKIGIDMAEAAEKIYKEHTRISAILYDNFRNEAKAYGEVIPSEKIKIAAEEFADQLKRGQITLTDDTKLPEKYAGELVDYIKLLRKLPDNITMDGFDSIVGKLGDLMDQGQRQGANIAFGTRLKDAAEVALSEISAPELKEVYDTANKFYSTGVLDAVKRKGASYAVKTNVPLDRLEGGKANFETPTAKRFMRSDKKMFEPGYYKSGTINRDELIKVVDNLSAPKDVSDLRKLVGDEQLGALARDKVSAAFEKAAIQNESGTLISYSGDAFKRALGMIGEGKLSQEAFEELLKSTQVDPTVFNDLLKVMETIEIPKSMSTFIARKAGLSGIRGLLTSLLPVAGAGGAGTAVGGPVGGAAAIAGTIMLRYSNKILSSPEMLATLRKSVMPSVTQMQRRQMLGRVVDYLQAFEDQQDFEGQTQ